MKKKSESKPSEFTLAVIAQIKRIPAGKVATYGQIARLAGNAHGARGVVWILNSSSKKHRLPWQRVLNAKGQIGFSPGTVSFTRQKRLLEAEGVEFATHTGVDLKVFQWKKGLEN